MGTLNQINLYFRISCLLGFLLSYYAFFVHLKKDENEDYEAFCDINEQISCTKAFSSEYGKGLGIIGKIFGKDSKLNQPNSIGGIIFYLLLILTSFSSQKSIIKLQTILCLISNCISLYLAYILYYILNDFCVVCVATYVINAINLFLSVKKSDLVENQLAKKPL